MHVCCSLDGSRVYRSSLSIFTHSLLHSLLQPMPRGCSHKIPISVVGVIVVHAINDVLDVFYRGDMTVSNKRNALSGI